MAAHSNIQYACTAESRIQPARLVARGRCKISQSQGRQKICCRYFFLFFVRSPRCKSRGALVELNWSGCIREPWKASPWMARMFFRVCFCLRALSGTLGAWELSQNTPGRRPGFFTRRIKEPRRVPRNHWFCYHAKVGRPSVSVHHCNIPG